MINDELRSILNGTYDKNRYRFEACSSNYLLYLHSISTLKLFSDERKEEIKKLNPVWDRKKSSLCLHINNDCFSYNFSTLMWSFSSSENTYTPPHKIHDAEYTRSLDKLCLKLFSVKYIICSVLFSPNNAET